MTEKLISKKGITVFKTIDKSKLKEVLNEIKEIQSDFFKEFGVDDIISNSKIFEVVIANTLGHKLIPGHSGYDAQDDNGGMYDYKHYKETSSNHSWSFNDYTDNSIERLEHLKAIIFAHINDTTTPIFFDWYYEVPGSVISNYLKTATAHIRNIRKMINVSPRQIERKIRIRKVSTKINKKGLYTPWIDKIFEKIEEMEKISDTKGLLTSNKFWEVLVANELNHNVLSEQGGRAGAHDAIDSSGNSYEYKVAKSYSWNFQDISEEVLRKYLSDEEIILATVDKKNFGVKSLFTAKPTNVINVLREKLRDKMDRCRRQGRELRRKQVSLSKVDLTEIQAIQII